MIKNWKITAFFLFASLFVVFISGNIKFENENIPEGIGLIIGSLLIIYILPLFITFIFSLIGKWKNNETKSNYFVRTFSIIWGILALLIVVSSLNSKIISSENNSGYLYKPYGSDYSVIFTNKPKITSTVIPISSKSINGEIAQVDLSNYYEKVEFCLFNESEIGSFNKEAISKLLNDYCRINGLNYPEITFNKLDEKEKNAELRAYKITKTTNGNKRFDTFVVRLFIKNKTFFVTTVAAESKDFPTPQILKFWESIKINQ